MGAIRYLKSRALNWALPLPPFDSPNHAYSTVSFVEPDGPHPSPRLLDISLEAINVARNTDMRWLSGRMKRGPYVPEIWPGEHYKLLAGLVAVFKPKRVVEVGTFTGLSALAIKNALPKDGEIITVDIVPWDQFEETAFRPDDFAGGRLRQAVGDLSDSAFFASFADTLSSCDLLFLDGPKNVVFERTVLQHLSNIRLPKEALVLFDDTRLWNMLEIWHDLQKPKLDLTSFGHYTGTGLVDWNG